MSIKGVKIFAFSPSKEGMKTNSLILKTVFLFLFLIQIPRIMFADSPRIIAHQVQGSVKVQRKEELILVHEGTRFQENDKVMTEKDGYVDVIANEQWGMRLLPSSESLLVQVQNQQTKLELASGDFLFNVRPLGKEEKFEVETPTAVLAVRGTKFWGRITPKNVLSAGSFAVKEGIIEVTLKELKIPVTLAEDQAVDLPVGYAFPEVRSVSENEKADMKKIDSIPLFLLKANIGDQLALLQDLKKLKKPAQDKPSNH